MDIIMIDMDGVVIDKNYKTTKNIKKITTSIQKKGDCLIIPNSDTPILRLSRFFSEFLDLDCKVLIGELGVVVNFFDRIVYTCDCSGLDDYKHKLKKVFESQGMSFLSDDSLSVLRGERDFSKNLDFVLMDSLRWGSVSLFFRRFNASGGFVMDKKWDNACLEIINSVPLPKTLQAYDYNEKYGIAISNVCGASKTKGFSFIKNHLFFPDVRFYMIGDSDADIIYDPDVIHLAVGNAANKLKEKSVFVADKDYTEGLEECLLFIRK